MGIKFSRDYEEINRELAEAVKTIEDFYSFFEMDDEDWREMPEEDKMQLAMTLSDDVFYALGSEGSMTLGSGFVNYDKKNNTISVTNDAQNTVVISLIN